MNFSSIHKKVKRYKKNWIRWKNRSSTKKILNNYFKDGGTKKLQIGCGTNIMAGWLNTDIEIEHSEVAFLDVGSQFPFKDNSFDFIFSEHIFEHLTFNEATNMLSECNRILKSQGVIRLATPDFSFLFRLYNESEKPIHQEYVKWATENFSKDVARKLNPNQYKPLFVINNFFKDWGHQIIHDFQSLKMLLEKEGFVGIEKHEIHKSKYKELRKIEKHGEVIPEKFNELETLVVEAVKPR